MRWRTSSLLLLPLLVWPLTPALAQSDDTGGLQGTTHSSDGQALRAEVTARRDPCPSDGPCEWSTRADEDGMWWIEELPAGEYRVRAVDPSGAHAPTERPDPVQVNAGRTRAGIQLVLSPGGVITGVVTTWDGGVVSGGTVAIEGTGLRAPIDEDGRYVLSGVPEGTLVLVVTPDDEDLRPTEVEVALTVPETATVDVPAFPRTPRQVRVAGETRTGTAIAVSERDFPDGAETVLIATAATYPDALAAAPLATREGAPILLVGDRLPAEVTAEIRRLDAERAIIVGAVDAVSVLVQSELERLGLEVQRVAGESRFDTAALTALDLGLSSSGEVVVAYGGGFADALSIGPLAARDGLPILLVDRTQLTADTAAAVAELDPSATLVVGGPAVVGEEVAAALPEPRRVAGDDRYATNVAVADLVLERGGSVGRFLVATGRDFPDALTASPSAARANAPLVLLDGLDPVAATANALRRAHDGAIGEVVVFGGPVAVSDEVVDALVTGPRP